MKGAGGRQKPVQRRLGGFGNFVRNLGGIHVPDHSQQEEERRAERILADFADKAAVRAAQRASQPKKGTAQHVNLHATKRDPRRMANERRRQNRAARLSRKKNRV